MTEGGGRGALFTRLRGWYLDVSLPQSITLSFSQTKGLLELGSGLAPFLHQHGTHLPGPKLSGHICGVPAPHHQEEVCGVERAAAGGTGYFLKVR